MKLAIVAYPVFHERDQKWIETLRKRFDPQASKIRAHFTLIFPAGAVEDRSVRMSISPLLSGCKRISFTIKEARAVRDPLGRRSHVFLVPEKGGKDLIALHDKLYGGVFLPHLRKDVPFVPHVTVAESGTLQSCARLAEGLNRSRFPLRGVVRDIELIEVRESKVRRIARFVLENRNGSGRVRRSASPRRSVARRRD